jgi:hypothetical protein
LLIGKQNESFISHDAIRLLNKKAMGLDVVSCLENCEEVEVVTQSSILLSTLEDDHLIDDVI